MRKVSLVVPASFGLAIGSGALAQSYEFQIDQEASTSELSVSVDVPFDGTLIGDYDEETNPDGTQTRPGLFGGSGNQPVEYSAAFGLAGGSSTSPGGAFSLDVDRPAGTAEMNGLLIDILGGVGQQLDATLTINFENFRTYNPDSVFFGGFDIEVPIGTVDLLLLSVAQIEPATLFVSDDGKGNTVVSGLVPSELSMQIVVMGQDLGTFALPSLFPFEGILVENDNGAELLIQASLDIDQVIPGSEEPFEAIPFELPTVLPPGGVASILINGMTNEGAISGVFSVAMSADADSATCAENPDINGDGVVDGTDLTTLLGDWNAPGGPADINCDEIVNGLDLTILLGSWGQG